MNQDTNAKPSQVDAITKIPHVLTAEDGRKFTVKSWRPYMLLPRNPKLPAKGVDAIVKLLQIN